MSDVRLEINQSEAFGRAAAPPLDFAPRGPNGEYLQGHPAAPVETPSAAIIKDANRVVIVTDARGRKLSVKRMDKGLASFRIARLLGDDAGNGVVFAQAMLYVSCTAINDDPIPFPKSELQLEALIDRLDLDGLQAIQKAQQEEFGIGASAEEAAAEAKN